jgi:toxin ParE1/3/4
MLPEAETEAEEAAGWYEEQLRGFGFDFLDALAIALEAIEKYPRRHAKVPGRFRSREVRRVLLQRFPYKVIYEVRPRESVVLAIAHGRRRPTYWRRRN